MRVDLGPIWIYPGRHGAGIASMQVDPTSIRVDLVWRLRIGLRFIQGRLGVDLRSIWGRSGSICSRPFRALARPQRHKAELSHLQSTVGESVNAEREALHRRREEIAAMRDARQAEHKELRERLTDTEEMGRLSGVLSYAE